MRPGAFKYPWKRATCIVIQYGTHGSFFRQNTCLYIRESVHMRLVYFSKYPVSNRHWYSKIYPRGGGALVLPCRSTRYSRCTCSPWLGRMGEAKDNDTHRSIKLNCLATCSSELSLLDSSSCQSLWFAQAKISILTPSHLPKQKLVTPPVISRQCRRPKGGISSSSTSIGEVTGREEGIYK